MTDEEIIQPGRIVFPNGGLIDVDSLSLKGQVCYRRWRPGEDDADWLRTPIEHFVMLVRKANGRRP